jgi:hypothetical protein
MKLSQNCKTPGCGKNDFEEVKEITPITLGNEEKIVCRMV